MNISAQFITRPVATTLLTIGLAVSGILGFRMLPVASLPMNPTYRKVNPADAPIIIYALTSDTMSTGQMYDAASSIIQQRLSRVEGVGQVFVGGSSLPAVRVDLNPQVLSRHGIGLEDVRQTLAATNVRRPTGRLVDGDVVQQIDTNDQLHKAEQYRPIVVAWENGAPLQLSEVADVQDSVEDLRAGGLSNGQPAVLVVVFRSPGANVIQTVDNVRAAFPQLQASLPAAIRSAVVLDRTPTIRASLHDVEMSLIISVILVTLVVFAFLRSPRAALIPTVAVPVSLIGTFGIMWLCGYSLDNLSLTALTISTGFVVDDAIVVLENIMRHVEAGMKPRAAALQGAREIGFTVLSISVSLVAVFLPILLMGGIIGRLFREFAAVLTAAVLISLVVSLTTTPMMCGALLRHEPDDPNRRRSIRERALDGMTAGYRHGLGWVLRHPFLMLLVTLGTVALSVKLFMVVPKGFFPQQDTGRLAGGIQAAQDISFQSMSEKLAEVVGTIAKDENVASVLGFTGGGGGGGGNAINTGRLYITLTSPDTRTLTSDEVIARLRGPLSSIPGAPTFLQSVQDLRIGGRPGNAQYQYTLQAGSVEELAAAGNKVLAKFRSMPELADVSTDQQDRGLQATLVVDRDTAYRLGISAKLLDDTLYDAFGQRQVAITYTQLNQYHLVMEVAPKYWQDPEILHDLFIRSADGTQVPLSAFTHFEPAPTNLAVNHQGQFPSVTLSFNLAPGVALGDAVLAITNAMHDLGLPQSVHGSFAGAAQAFQASLSSEPVLILAALLTVYLVLGILYESYIHPITILSTLPSAGVGALLALILTGSELNVMGLIGIILLIGIVKKNAIMMIDFALDAERSRNIGPKEAVYEACLLRFRPIMMTTLAAMFGALPLALSRGVGAELRRPLGIAIVGGLIVSQALTLFTTPVIYLYLDRLRAWTVRARGALRRRLFGGAARPTEAHTP